jgi:Trypsin-like peptidase domain/TIR domain
MAQSLYDLLYQCTVVVQTSQSQGTGFFVAPGLVLTCAHVVEDAQKNSTPVEVHWKAQERTLPAQIEKFDDVSKTDLALLKVDINDNPCVLLYDAAEPRDFLYSFGYPDTEPTGASTTFELEGWAGSQRERLKFKQGQARPGMSGSPLLNWDTGGVCGIVQLSYSTSTAAAVGGSGLLTKIILQEFPELIEQQKQYHQQYREWIDSLDAVQRPKIKLDWLILSSTGPIEIFTAYDQEDETLRKQLINHLVQMKRNGLIAGHDDKLQPGTEQEEEEKKRLDRARIILMLVSPDFLASDYHYNVEMQRALERHQAKAARVIPIILRDTPGWKDTKFAGLLALPRNKRPVVEWGNRDAVFAEITGEIKDVVESLKK